MLNGIPLDKSNRVDRSNIFSADKNDASPTNNIDVLSTDKSAAFFVQGEPLLCYSMLANLVKNAIEACLNRGK